MRELIKPNYEDDPLEEVTEEQVEAYVECPNSYSLNCPNAYHESCPLNYASDNDVGGDILF